jgi:subtilisin family serine protease
MRRLVLFSLFFCILISWTTANAQVGKIIPELQRTLQSSQPGDEVSVIITLSDKADIRPFKDKPKSLRRADIIKVLKNKADLTQSPLKIFLESRNARKIKSLWLINGMAVTATVDVIRELATLPGVEEIRPDETIRVPEITYAPLATPEWNVSAINAPALWNQDFTGTGVVVANMDTGVDVNHSDLNSKWRGGTNSWFDPFNNTTLPYDFPLPPPYPPIGHGTGTMGVMVGGDSGGTTIGVAPGAQWIAVKIFNDAGDSSSSVIHQGFQWLLDPDLDPDTNDSPDVVNASWGLDLINVCDLQFLPDMQALKAAGIAVAFSAGNYGPNSSTSISPANYPESFAVGAVDENSMIAPFSSRGPSACDRSIFPEVVAPGVSIKTSDLTSGGVFPNSYAYVSGTSFAAPHVAGAMALLLSAFPDLTVDELELALKQSAVDLGTIGADNSYGYGLIDVSAAYLFVQNPVISVYPSSYNFGKLKEGLLSSSQTFTVTNQGLQDLMVDAASISGTNSSDFGVLSDTCSGQVVVSAGSCNIQVVFEPTSGGSKSAELLISSNDPNQNPYHVTLSGKGIERYNLGVTILGTGSGKIISEPKGIDCAADGTNCSRLFLPGTEVTLQAVPEGDSGFGGWSGCNSSSGRTCQVIMGRDKTVTGTFVAPSLTLTSPNGGESLKVGTYKRIKWTYTGRPGPYVKIELLQGAQVIKTIVNKAPRGSSGKGYFDWFISKKLTDGADYEIRITSARNPAYTDMNEAPFMIYH